MTTRFEIHPAIGIARVGSSPTWFIGPEPGEPGPARYRDEHGALLRQAARFRVYECQRDADGTLVAARETGAGAADITWTVHLVNRKAASAGFLGALRNPEETDRERLVIDPGPRSVSGPGGTARLGGGRFRNTSVPLGEIVIDSDGRLCVAGGSGRAGSEPQTGIEHFANNDNWWDDTSDGPVSAVVRTSDGTEHDAVPAWVIVAPPDFAPPILNFVTLYDVALDAAVARGWRRIPPRPSFTRDVYPILARPYGYSWVTELAVREHRGWGPTSSRWARLADPDGDADDRHRLLSALRKPGDPAAPGRMPRLNDDTEKNVLPPSATQYEILTRWAAGEFIGDWGSATGPDEPVPDALDRVALQAGSGGAFFPGIEASSVLADPVSYREAYRLDPGVLAPGAVTEGCALPWQADFIACRQQNGRGWWPSQRPDHVHRDPTDVDGRLVPWARGVTDAAGMVASWDRLGVVVERPGPAGRPVYVEAERLLPEPAD